MAYLSKDQLLAMGFRSLGENVKISDKASIYDADQMSIGNNSRIDDFCVISGRVEIGEYCHITPMCLVAGGEGGVYLSDFVTLAYGVKIFSQSDDYSGNSMVNSLVSKKYKNETIGSVKLGRQVIIGAGATVLPNAHITDGCSVGAMSLVTSKTVEWGMYVGIPARRIKERSRKLLSFESEFLDGVR